MIIPACFYVHSMISYSLGVENWDHKIIIIIIEILARPRFCFSDFRLLSRASTLSSFWILFVPPTKTRTSSHQ